MTPLSLLRRYPSLPMLGFAVGTGLWLFHRNATIVPHWILLLAALVSLALSLRWRSAVLPLLVCLVLGATNFRAEQIAAQRLPSAGTQDISGTIAALPLQYGEKIRLLLAPDQVGANTDFDALLRLEVPARVPEQFAYGQRWRFRVKLAPLDGPRNPGAYDARFHDFWLGIRGQGTVLGMPVRLDGVGGHALMRRVQDWRGQIIDASNQALPRADAGLVQALTIGVQNQIPAEQWDRFKDTGTAHLMVISGSHITLVAGLFFGLVSLLWRLSPPLVSRIPAQRVAAAAMMLAALGYGLLAGMELPVQRAVIMIWVMATGVLLGRELRLWHSLSLAALLVFLLQPGAVMEASFWLSFLAVAVIFALIGLHGSEGGWWRRLWSLQIGISLALLPVLALLFGQLPLLSPLANLLAIPVVEMLATPLALIGAGAALLDFDLLGRWCFHVAATALQWLDMALHALNQLPGVHWLVPAPSPWVWVSVAIGLFLLFLPSAWPGRWLGLLAFAPLFFPKAPDIAVGTARLAVLDAGPASAVVLHTRQHHLVWQADPKHFVGSTRRVLTPYLRQLGVDAVDGWVADLSHPRASPEMPRQPPPARIWKNAGNPLATGQPCNAGTHWSWDGVHFEFLDPLPADAAHGCVLAVYGRGWQILLFSRADERVAQRLRERFGAGLNSDLLIMPEPGLVSLPLGDLVLCAYDREQKPARETVLSTRTQGALIFDLDKGARRLSDGPAKRYYWL